MKTNLRCPNCNTRLTKTSVRRVYECGTCWDSFVKVGKHLRYSDVVISEKFPI